MKLVVIPDSVVDKEDRSLWMTPPFDKAFSLTVVQHGNYFVSGTYSAPGQVFPDLSATIVSDGCYLRGGSFS